MPTFLPIDPSLPSNQRRDDMDRKVGMTWLRRYFPNGLQFQKKASWTAISKEGIRHS